MNKNLLYILTILEAVEKIQIYTKGYHSADEFFRANVQKDFNATLNLLIAIGEEAKKIDDSFKEDMPKIKWMDIVGLRNKLSHDYRGVDPDVIWDIVSNYMMPLKVACLEIFKKIKPDRESLEKILSSIYYQNIRYLLEIK